MQRSAAVMVAAMLGIPMALPAQFVSDEFNGGSLGSQWTWHDSSPAGSTHTLTGSSLRMTSKEGSDFWGAIDAQCYVQQSAPAGTNWEVVTRVDNFDPRATGFKRTFIRTGIQLWQDNDHYITVGILGNADGTEVGIQAFWQSDPVAGRHENRFFGENYLGNVTSSPLYLKLLKTPKGYSGQISGDGTNWTTVLPLVRNPETADGSFTAEKIRLYQSGGPANGTGVSSPADFDYIRSTTLASPPAGYANDEFNGSSLASTWSVYPGVLQGTVSVNNGSLKLTPGAGQDQWEHVERAMHVYQDAPTSNAFSVVAKVGPTDLRPYEQWLAYGIMLWQDQSNWIMITNQRSEGNPPTNRIEVGFKRNGNFDPAHQDFGAGALPQYLKIEKNGATLSPLYSFDNQTWVGVPAAGFTHPDGFKNPQVRLLAKRVFATGPVPTVEFDWLHIVPGPTAAADWQLFE